MDKKFIKTILEKIKGRNIFLVGMMGCGKSTIGPKLAQFLDYKFIDLDSLIEKVSDKAIDEIFMSDGEEAFRKIESQCLQETVLLPSLIVSTGGGIVMKSENWGILRQGIVVWIDLDKDIALKRLGSDIQNRPLLKGKDFKRQYNQIFESRKNLYAQADLKVEISNQNIEEVIENILLAISQEIFD